MALSTIMASLSGRYSHALETILSRFDAQACGSLCWRRVGNRDGHEQRRAPRLFACFFAFSLLKVNAPTALMQPFPSWPIGAFPLFHGTFWRKTWNASSLPVIPAHRVGRRDRAILLLLARMGLRAGDIVQLRLRISTGRSRILRYRERDVARHRLPLTQEVGDAIVDYLKTGRPRHRHRCDVHPLPCTFSCLRISRCRLGHCCSGDVQSRVSCPSRGAAHVLRHSAATAMLRHGASLQDIASRPSPPLYRNDRDLRQGRRDCPATDRSSLAGGAAMLAHAVESYLSVRRACGFDLKSPGQSLAKFCHLLGGERQTPCVLSNRNRVGRIGAISPPAGPPPQPGD